MSIFDFFKKGILDEFTGTITIDQLLLSLATAFIIAMFIIYIYKKTYSGVVYSKTFSLCVILLAMVTSLIIRTISFNLALSLGMVGALSIVRFRTAIKDPVDTGFMFWGITAGIMSGAGLYLVSIVSSVALGLLYFLSYLIGFRVSSQYLLVIKYDLSVNDKVNKLLNELPKHKLRSKSIVENKVEVTFDIDIKDNKDEVIKYFENVKGINNVSLISYQNDFGA